MGTFGFPGTGVYGPPNQLSWLSVGPGSLSVNKRLEGFKGKNGNYYII